MTIPPSTLGTPIHDRAGGTITRRALLTAAGAVTITGLPNGPAVAAADDEPVPTADGRWYPFVRDRTLYNTTVMQCFGFDHVAKRIYVLQLKDSAAGHLYLNQLDYTGTLLSHMVLYGFGHGGNIGVERDGGSTYVWTETDSNPASGYGRAITRFRYTAGTTLTYGESDLVVHRPVPGSTSNQPYVDQENRQLIVRHRVSGDPKFGIYDLDAAIAGDYEPLHYIDQYVGEPGEVFQGFCLHRNRVLQSTGAHYSDEDGDNPPSGGGNAYVSTLDAATGELIVRRRHLVARDMDYREPEGMAIQPTRSPRVFIGLVSGQSGARRFSLYHRSFAGV